MLTKVNLKNKLEKTRSRRVSGNNILQQVAHILEENEENRNTISQKLRQNNNQNFNNFNFDALEAQNIFHEDDIKNLCITYRLRFLDSKYFKGTFPAEAISKIRELEKAHNTSISGFKIVAPAKLLKLENADDPLLFAPMGNGYYYLIHQWGNDLHPLRKLMMWPYKNFDNLLITILLVSILLTALTPMQAFTKGKVTQTEYLMMFLFMFKAVAGVVLFYGFAKGKNFNEAIWNSNYYNA